MSRVDGKMSRVEGKMSRVQKCRLRLLTKSQNSYVVSASLNSLHFCIRLNTFMQLAAFRRYPGIAARKFITLWLYAQID